MGRFQKAYQETIDRLHREHFPRRLAELREQVDQTINEAPADPEKAHAREDSLMRHWVGIYVPDEALAEFQRLWDAEFPRWSA